MILAEITDKFLPGSFYVCAASLTGVGTAVAQAFFRGKRIWIICSIVWILSGFLAWKLQIDKDLVEAARKELGQNHLALSRYWILGSLPITAMLTVKFRGFNLSVIPLKNVSSSSGAL